MNFNFITRKLIRTQKSLSLKKMKKQCSISFIEDRTEVTIIIFKITHHTRDGLDKKTREKALMRKKRLEKKHFCRERERSISFLNNQVHLNGKTKNKENLEKKNILLS